MTMNITSSATKCTAILLMFILWNSSIDGSYSFTIRSKISNNLFTKTANDQSRNARMVLCISSPSHNHDDDNDNYPLRTKREIVKKWFKNLTLKLHFQRLAQSVSVFFNGRGKRNFASALLVNLVVWRMALQFVSFDPTSSNPSAYVQQQYSATTPVTTVAASTRPNTGHVESKPSNIPYSTFMDYCESQKQQQGLGILSKLGIKKKMIHLDNVQMDNSGKLEYRILQAKTPSERRALRKYIQNTASGGDNNENQAHNKKLLSMIPDQQSAYTQTMMKNANPQVIRMMRQANVAFEATSTEAPATSASIAPTLVLAGVAYTAFKQSPSSKKGGGGGPGMLVMTKKKKNGGDLLSKPKQGEGNGCELSAFDDIQGVDEAKQSVMELVDTLRNREKYALVGARAPTGLLLEGPPGTGKTTLARACASLADVPMLHCSGSAFVEKYVGTGAARVRKLFHQASQIEGPVIIFIDEIDALGKSRNYQSSGSGGTSSGNSDEAEQTLNQLLSSMDGLEEESTSQQICVLGATNRKDVLDPALVRPGRFDRIVTVNLPNTAGREQILRVHAKKLLGFTEGSGIDPHRANSLGHGKAVDLSAVAAATEGLSGAELECIVNEAAIYAVRRVGEQLEQSQQGQKIEIDNAVYPEDFEASVESFKKSRRKNNEKGKKKIGIQLGDTTEGPSSSLATTTGKKRFFKKNEIG